MFWTRAKKSGARRNCTPVKVRLFLEPLEARLVPTVTYDTWTNTTAPGNWSYGGNWSATDGAPESGDIAIIPANAQNITVNAGIGVNYDTTIAGIQIAAGWTGQLVLQQSLTMNYIDGGNVSSINGGNINSPRGNGIYFSNGSLTWGGGTIDNGAFLAVSNGVSGFDITGTSSLGLNARVFQGAGNATINAATINASSLGQGTFVNSGVLTQQSGSSVIGVNFRNTGTLNIDGGTLTLGAASGRSTLTQDGPNAYSNLYGGSLTVNSTYQLNMGTLNGNGNSTITGNVTDTGATIYPSGADNTGTLTITGNFTMQGGTLNINVVTDDTGKITSNDLLSVGGALTLQSNGQNAGQLSMDVITPNPLNAGQTITVVNGFTNLTGNFGMVAPPWTENPPGANSITVTNNQGP
jgi:hypothetical protein